MLKPIKNFKRDFLEGATLILTDLYPVTVKENKFNFDNGDVQKTFSYNFRGLISISKFMLKMDIKKIDEYFEIRRNWYEYNR